LQPWYNFHLYFAIPLILHFVHAFFETGRWRNVFLAGHLTAVQMFGNLSYFIPITTWVITLYIFFFVLVARPFRYIKLDRRSIWAALGIAVSLASIYALTTVNTHQIQLYSYGRDPSGKATLDSFLNYGGSFDLRKWLELLWGVSPFRDMTLFMGVLSVPLLVLSVLKIERRNAHLSLLIAVLILFSTAGPVAKFFYFIWPMMGFFRHLALVSPVIKLFLCFQVGLGWEVLLTMQRNGHKNFVVLGSFLMAAASLAFLNMNQSAQSASGLIDWVLHKQDAGNAGAVLPYFADHTDLDRLTISASILFLIAVLLILISRFRSRPGFYFLVGLLVAVHTADIYFYKFVQFRQKTVRLQPDVRSLADFQPMPYQRARIPADTKVSRDKILDQLDFEWIYWSTYCFLFKDTIDSGLRTDYWLKPFDEFLRAYGNVSLTDRAKHPKGFQPYGFLLFPPYASAEKLGGLKAEKLALFSSAYGVSDREWMAGLLRDPHFSGDLLFVEGSLPGVVPWTGEKPLDTSDRIPIKYDVVKYDANHLEIAVNNPTAQPAWLLYSDVWDPSWHATVNGQDVPVLKAVLAYKAVMVGPGRQTVCFYFSSPGQTVLSVICAVMALCWFFGTIFLIMNIIKRN
jgi:hypothetical protein